jgi:hypothetical protein
MPKATEDQKKAQEDAVERLSNTRAYVGVMQSDATSMTWGQFLKFKGQTIQESDCAEAKGYYAQFTLGGVVFHSSWFTKEVFERSNFQIEGPRKISEKDTDAFILGETVDTIGNRHAMLTMDTLSGFELADTCSCASPETYSENEQADCIRTRLRDQLTRHLGFVLQWARNGLKGTQEEGPSYPLRPTLRQGFDPEDQSTWRSGDEKMLEEWEKDQKKQENKDVE